MESAKGVLQEHEDLNVLVRDLSKVSAWETALLLEGPVLRRLRTDLHSICVQLRRHFETEEAGHYLEEIGRRDPIARDELKSLHGEHPRLMARFDKAREHFENAIHEAPDVFQNLLLETIQLLRRHEQRETALVKKVFSS